MFNKGWGEKDGKGKSIKGAVGHLHPLKGEHGGRIAFTANGAIKGGKEKRPPRTVQENIVMLGCCRENSL